MNLSKKLDPWSTVLLVARHTGDQAIGQSVNGLTFPVIRGEQVETEIVRAYTDAGRGFGVRTPGEEAAEYMVSATDLDEMGQA